MLLSKRKILDKKYKIFFLFFLANISCINAHNFHNGGCNDHCETKFETINNETKLINTDDQRLIDSYNSCLNKSLCRG